MAQSGFTPIQLYRTATASAAPSAGNLADGELAINTNDGLLFYKDSGGVVRTIASAARTSGVFAPGTVSAPGITFTGDTNTGIYSPAADTIAFTEGGVEAMRLDASGNVGIGVSAPQGRFNVSGGRAFFGPNGETYAIGVGFNQTRVNSGQTYYIGATDSATPSLVFSDSGGTERMRISAAGNIGIGNANPAGTRLVISNNRAVDPTLQAWDTFNGATFENTALFLYDGTRTYLGNFQANPLAFGTNNLERMRIDASGNVGIGTSAPNAVLDVARSATAATLNVTSGANALQIVEDTAGDAGFVNYASGKSVSIAQVGAGFVNIGTNSVERMRIDSAGNVGIGTSSPGGRLDVFAASGVQINASNGTISQRVGYCGFGNAFSGSSSNHPYVLLVNDTERMRIDTSGNVGVGTSSPAQRLDVQGGSVMVGAGGAQGKYLARNTGGVTILDFGVGTGTGFGDSIGLYNLTSSGLIAFGTNNTERLRIANAGQIGIGGANYGTSGQVLTSNGAAAAPSWQTPGGTANGLLLNVQVFTSSGTYTRTAGATRAVVVARGGGGGGAGWSPAGGCSVVQNNGGNGGTTSFGSHVSAGGGGGVNSLGGGAGGTGGTGAIFAIRGTPGVPSGSAVAGAGAGEGGANSRTNTISGPGNAGERGGGGGSASGGVNGAGAGQGEFALDYITSGLGATETVTIGAGGSGGSGAGGGAAGGAGGAGYVIVYEYS